MRRFKSVKGFGNFFHGKELPKGAVYGSYKGTDYYCDHLQWKRICQKGEKQWYQIHIHIWNPDLCMWEQGKNTAFHPLCEFVGDRIRHFHLEKTEVIFPLKYKEAKVLPKRKMPQTHKGYEFRAGNLHNRTMTDVDSCRPYRIVDDYGIKP